MSDISWTAREAFACAYCWSEFHSPEKREDTPEAYWRNISEKARNECRRIANQRLILSVARGDAVSLPPAYSIPDAKISEIKERLGYKRSSRVTELLRVVYSAFKPSAPGERSA